MESLTIGQLAKQAGVNLETVRFYERKGLLPDPPRRASGYRQYPVDMVHRILFIKQAQELGFTLKEAGELLALRVDSKGKCSEVKERAEAKIADIEGKITSLQRMRKALLQLTQSCRGMAPIQECPILDAMVQKGTRRA